MRNTFKVLQHIDACHGEIRPLLLSHPNYILLQAVDSQRLAPGGSRNQNTRRLQKGPGPGQGFKTRTLLL